MKDGNNDELVFVAIDFVHDDVGKSRNRPFVGVGDAPGMAEVWEFREPVAISEDARYDVRGCRWAALSKVKSDSVDMSERF
jgi:hypothetical protein